MRLFPVVSLAFMLPGSVSVVAQNAAAIQSNTIVTTVVLESTVACPVALRAQHGADGNIRKVDKNRPEGNAQLLHLIISSRDSRQIEEARLTVRGTSGKGRVNRADLAPGGMDAARDLTVRFKPGADNEIVADAWVPGMTAVLQVDVKSVTFAGGSIQAFGVADRCRFTPEHLMLIADQNSH
jgi:hypothetical protein